LREIVFRRVCQACKTPTREVAKSYSVGCLDCYKNKEQVDTLLNEFHGAGRHIGKVAAMAFYGREIYEKALMYYGELIEKARARNDIDEAEHLGRQADLIRDSFKSRDNQ
jgi:protein-arginine kinase activator protein McsA